MLVVNVMFWRLSASSVFRARTASLPGTTHFLPPLLAIARRLCSVMVAFDSAVFGLRRFGRKPFVSRSVSRTSTCIATRRYLTAINFTASRVAFAKFLHTSNIVRTRARVLCFSFVGFNFVVFNSRCLRSERGLRRRVFQDAVWRFVIFEGANIGSDQMS